MVAPPAGTEECAEDARAAGQAPPPRARRRALARRAALGLLLFVGLSLAALPAGLWWLSETAGGRAFAARQISAFRFDNGLRIEVAAIEGSLLSDARVRGVTLYDLDGPFARIGQMQLVWRPLAFLLHDRLDIARLLVPEMVLARRWNLAPDPEAPLLPRFDVRIGRFEVGRLRLGDGVAGGLDEAALEGAADIRAGRLLLDTAAAARGGDRLVLRLDAEPEADRFDLAARLRAPEGGLLLRLLGLGAPLDLRAGGAGTWRAWRGDLVLDAGAGRGTAGGRVAALRLTARDGRFGATGTLALAPLLGSLPEALAAPVRLEAAAWQADSALRARLLALTDALALAGGGGLDPARGRLTETTAELSVRKPEALLPGLVAPGLRAGVRLSGPVRRPEVAWDASAARILLPGATRPVGLEAPAARGRLRWAPEGGAPAVPFEISALAPLGLPPELAPLLAAPRASGTLVAGRAGLRVPDLRLSAAGVSARADARVDPATGAWLADLSAEAPRVARPGLGAAALAFTGRLASGPSGAGRLEVRLLALENAGLREALGGRAEVGANVRLGADGLLRIAGGRLRAPGLSVSGASGLFDPRRGTFRLEASGQARRLGPFALAASGTAEAPRATLRLPRPDLGLGLAGVTAEIAPAAGGGFRLSAAGQSPAGPLEARIGITTGPGRPLALLVERLAVAGLAARGRLERAPAGPFAGGLDLSGRGLEGTLTLSAAGPGGALQRARLALSAARAQLPLDPPVTIGRGRLDALALLGPAGPELAATLSASDIRRETLVLAALEGRGRLAGGQAQAEVSASGRLAGRDPFRLDARADTIPEGVRLALEGTVGRLPLRLAAPAEIHRRADGWELLPVRVALPGGQLDLAGAVGRRPFLSLAARDLDLAVLEALVPGLPLSGRVSGAARLALGGRGLPEGAGNLRVSGLARTDAGAPRPVDLVLALRSRPELLEAGLRMEAGGRTFGRAVARLAPGRGATARARLLSGALSGGVRYNGPAEPLWALAAVEGQELRGPVAIAADVGGTPARPVLSGFARGQGLVYRNLALGTVVEDLAFAGRFEGPALLLQSLTGRVKDGTVSAAGRIGFDTGAADSIDLGAELRRTRLAATDLADVTVSGPLRWRGSAARSELSGRLTVDRGRIVLQQLETASLPALPVRRADETFTPPPPPRFGSQTLGLDVAVRSADPIRIEGLGLDSRWRTDLRVRGTAARPELVGTATVVEGSYSFAGSDFTITQGRIGFNGAPLDSSLLVEASTTTSDGVTVFLTIGGTARRPEIALRSAPALPDDEILARLLFGTSVADLSLPEAVQLASALASLQGGGGLDPVGRVKRAAGLDKLRIVGDGLSPGMSTTLVIGQRLSRNLYVELQTDVEGNVVTVIKLALTPALDLLAQIASESRNSSVNLRYQRDR